MSGWPHSGEKRRCRRGGRLVGLAASTGAFVVLGMTPLTAAPSAHADIEDLFFDPIFEAAAQAVSLVDPGLASAIDPSFDLDSVVAPALAGVDDSLTSATIPLDIYNVTEPLVSLSVGGGPATDVVVDTGSPGLVLPWWDVGWQTFFQFPTDWGVGAYSGGMDYFYLTYQSTVDFGPYLADGQHLITDPTDVNVALFTWPVSWQGFFSGTGGDGVLGIAPDAVGPGTSNVLTALPEGINHGVLIDEANGVLRFGDNPLTGGITVPGVADADLWVSVNGAAPVQVPTIIDSGGVSGTIPSSAFPGGTVGMGAPVGTEVSVYADNGHTLLYSYTTDAGYNSPTVVGSGSSMNTGYYPFAQMPMYISYSPNSSIGTTTFGGS